MAFGVPPQFTLTVQAPETTPEQFLVTGRETLKALNWNIGLFNEYSLTATTGYSFSSWTEKITMTIANGEIKMHSRCLGSQMFDWGKNERNLKDFVLEYRRQKELMTDEKFAAALIDLKAEISIAEESLTDQPLEIDDNTSKSFLSFFIPRGDFFITPIIIDLNILIFSIMAVAGVSLLHPDAQTLVRWGGNFRPSTLNGGWWRLITNFFLHAGLIHLLANMYALLYIGRSLEPLMGRINFTVAYVLAGILASCNSLYWHGLTVSVGASGAIFGMYGVFLAFLTTDLIERSARRMLLITMAIFILYNLAGGLNTGSNVDNAAHLGGLISGVLIGYIFYPILTSTYSVVSTSVVIFFLSAATFLCSFFIYKKIPDEFKLWQMMMNSFTSNERLALEVYSRLPADSLMRTLPMDEAQRNDIMVELENRSIYYWNENIKMLNNANKFHLPLQFRMQNDQLITYCNLRIEICKLLHKGLLENNHNHDAEIARLQKQIDSIIDKIKNTPREN